MYPGKCQGQCNGGKGGFTYVLTTPANASDPLYTEWTKSGDVGGKPYANPVINSTGDDPSEEEVGYLAQLYYGLGMQLSALTPELCSSLAAESTSLHALSEKVRKPAAPSAEAAAREKKTSSFFSGPSKTSPASGAAGGSFMFMLIIVSLYVIALFP